MAQLKPSVLRIYATEFGLPPERDPIAEIREDLTAEIIEHPAYHQIVEYLRHAKALGLDAADPDVIRRAIGAGTRALDEEERAKREAMSLSVFATEGEPSANHPPLVYYMRMSDLVKIGTTTSIGQRVRALNPQGVMAVEPGGHDEERRRHREFASLRGHGEWFRLDARLGAHIAELRRHFEDQMGEPLEAWLGRQPTEAARRYRRWAAKAANRHATRPPVVAGEDSDVTLLPAALAARAVGVSPQLFNLWRCAGKVVPAAVTEKGRKLYRVTDVLAVSRHQKGPA